MHLHDPEIESETGSRGYLSFTLHAHLPWVVNHGTWPHGMEWLHEAAAETYLPLLRMLENLDRDGIALKCNLNLSPILLEQLAHPFFQAEFPRYLERKISAAREDESFFLSNHEHAYAVTARYWQRFFAAGLEQFQELGGRIHEGFRRFHERGSLEILTCAATHGYLPLLGTEESLRAQVRLAIQAHERHLGLTPRGMWIPECGYRPAGEWAFPVARADGQPFGPAFSRLGIEEILGESGLEFFLVDSHIVEEPSARVDAVRGEGAAAAARSSRPSAVGNSRRLAQAPHRRLYQPYYVGSAGQGHSPVAVFPRDPRTGLQVWSSDNGYPGDAMYLDFHKKRWPGGHRYWRVTGAGVDIADKQPYDPEAAKERIHSHASHFVDLVWKTLEPAFNDGVPPVLSAPFDAELFGHWWFEGPQWLEEVARILHTEPTGLELVSGSSYLDRDKPAATIQMHEGSWGAGGNHQVWLNTETEWTYRELYAAEVAVREICEAGPGRVAGPQREMHHRVLQQLCRELLLLESSDWQFLITTGAARDYAEQRFRGHFGEFEELRSMLRVLAEGVDLTEAQLTRLAGIEERDSIFPEIDPGLWCRATQPVPHTTLIPDDDFTALEPELEEDRATVIDGVAGELPKFRTHGEA
ncbi:1,4-alpha-glucan branching enzyme [Bryocella elongata]|uniref:1,4-alpha-glucan branching enzyme n=1 Tax=Bryocella elongata TaxID=863522 RepID=A0A1H6BZF8_9BACT|nr:1,4-alpha-glucan branching protein domain-containing protein [Bryocella elongata]SEG66099.1 1,4-alpha-glucan branching enzyme [Bryocella elongata]